jgi:hypothetical protein
VRPPWMAEVLETQEQFPVQAGIQWFQRAFWMPAFAGMTTKGLVLRFPCGQRETPPPTTTWSET